MSILEDKRSIDTIFFDDNCSLHVGKDDVERITVEREPGDGAWMPWFAVWSGGEIVSRWNAALIQGIAYVPARKRNRTIDVELAK